jgi:predicted Zn-dependent protease with MMP-like domain
MFPMKLENVTVRCRTFGGVPEAIFSYRMMLQDEWEWVKGGKIPGVCEFCDMA